MAAALTTKRDIGDVEDADDAVAGVTEGRAEGRAFDVRSIYSCLTTSCGTSCETSDSGFCCGKIGCFLFSGAAIGGGKIGRCMMTLKWRVISADFRSWFCDFINVIVNFPLWFIITNTINAEPFCRLYFQC